MHWPPTLIDNGAAIGQGLQGGASELKLRKAHRMRVERLVRDALGRNTGIFEGDALQA